MLRCDLADIVITTTRPGPSTSCGRESVLARGPYGQMSRIRGQVSSPPRGIGTQHRMRRDPENLLNPRYLARRSGVHPASERNSDQQARVSAMQLGCSGRGLS